MNKLQTTSILILLEKIIHTRRRLGSTVREKRYLGTAPSVGLNVVQMAQVWGKHEPQKKYSDFGEYLAWAFNQKIYSSTYTCLHPPTDSPEVMTKNCEIIELPLLLDMCFTMGI